MFLSKRDTQGQPGGHECFVELITKEKCRRGIRRNSAKVPSQLNKLHEEPRHCWRIRERFMQTFSAIIMF